LDGGRLRPHFGPIRNAGAQCSASVTFPIPLFGLIWDVLLLLEEVTL
jgi:hypothetical protein